MLKRKKDFDEASEENAWRLLAEVSLSEARFEEVKAMILEAIASCLVEGGSDILPTEAELKGLKPLPDRELAPVNNGSSVVMNGNHECLVQQ